MSLVWVMNNLKCWQHATLSHTNMTQLKAKPCIYDLLSHKHDSIKQLNTAFMTCCHTNLTRLNNQTLHLWLAITQTWPIKQPNTASLICCCTNLTRYNTKMILNCIAWERGRLHQSMYANIYQLIVIVLVLY